jgi:hypothetical protein
MAKSAIKGNNFYRSLGMEIEMKVETESEMAARIGARIFN